MCETYVYDLLVHTITNTINTIKLRAADHKHVLKFPPPIKLTTKLQKIEKRYHNN